MPTTRPRAHPVLSARRDRVRRRAVALLAVAALTVTGCSGTSGDASTADGGAGSATDATDDAPSDDTAPDDAAPDDTAPDDAASDDATLPDPDSPLAFTALDLTGAEVDLATLAGEPVVLWFWAPWCTICRGEGPHVADVVAELEEVTFIGVAGRGEVPEMEVFVSDTGTGGFTHLVDDDGSLWQRFGVTYQPAYAFIAADGTVDVVVGALGPVELTERATALVG